MKVPKRLRSLLLLTLLVPLAFGGVAFAQTAGTTSDETTETPTLQERLLERKTRLKTKLTTAQQLRLRGRCKAAQVKLVAYDTRVKTIQDNRKAAHKKILDALNNVVTKVGDKASTADLKVAITTLQTKTDAFDADVTAYKEAVSDAAEMDCEADAAAFQATLQDIRTQRADLATASTEIRTYVEETIKPLLQTIRGSLESKAGAK